MGLTEYIQQIGAYAGFAAVIGLAVLAALYFSTSRDLRRLRDEGVKGGGPPLPPPPGQAAQRLQSQGPPPRPVPVPPAGAKPAAASQATVVQAPTAPGARTPAGGAAPPPATAGRPGTAGTPPPPPPPRTGPGRPPRQPAGAPPRGRPVPKRPWYQEIEPRFLVLIVAGVLVVGGGIIALVSIGGGEEGGEPFRVVSEDGSTLPADGGTGGEKGTQVDPGSITVAVLNGTAVPGLAARVGDTVEAAGFKKGEIDNAPSQAANESQVLYVPGNEAAAEEVAKELDITQVGEVDAEAQSQAGDAQVVVVVGPDQAP